MENALENEEVVPVTEPDEEKLPPSEEPGEGEGEEEVVFFADEEPPKEDVEEHKDAPAWVKEVRKQNRELQRELKEAKAKLAEKQNPPVELPPRPKLADFDYDEEKYAPAIAEWLKKEEAAKSVEAEKAREAEEFNRAWEEKKTRYSTARQTVKMPGFEDAEAAVLATLNPVQQSIILAAADAPEKLVYALGRSEAKLKELAAIKDPVRLAYTVGRMEANLKNGTVKRPPPAESKVSGSAPIGGGYEKELAKLEAEADRTGDRTKVIAFKRLHKK